MNTSSVKHPVCTTQLLWEQRYFFDDKTCPFYRFHGTPDLTIEEIHESDDQRAALVSETGSQKVSAESSGESDCSQNTDVAILENSTKCEGKARYNDTIVIQKVGELIANLHILLVKKALKRICKGTIMNTRDVSMVGLLISRPTGIVFCKYIMPFTNVVPTLIDPAFAKLKLEVDVNTVLEKDVCTSIHYLLKSIPTD